MSSSILDDIDEIRNVDRSDMLSYCVNIADHYRQAERATRKILLKCPKPESIIVAGMGGSAIGGELFKDWASNRAGVPIEVSRDYKLPAYASQKTLAVIVSYSGETEETLSSFLDAVKKKCAIFCISSGGSLLEYAEKLSVPYLIVPKGMPPRAALPYLFLPLLMALEKLQIVSGVSDELSEAINLLEVTSKKCSPESPLKCNPAKSLAKGINGTLPIIYGFGIFRGVAQRFKTQFNENSKIPSKWEYFSELDHNEVVGWEHAGNLAEYLSTIFIRDEKEPSYIRNRIEITKTLIGSISRIFETWSQGRGELARMLSTICTSDFTSVYLAILRNVDPTPVNTIASLKAKIKQSGVKERIFRELELLSGSR
jgi:glucose/mannose-6-phosphate isomerase